MTARIPTSALTVPMSKLPAGHEKFLACPAERSLKMLHYRGNRNIANFAGRTENDLHGTFGNLLSDGDSKGDTDQVGVLELHSRPLIAVVEDHVESGRLEPLRNIF